MLQTNSISISWAIIFFTNFLFSIFFLRLRNKFGKMHVPWRIRYSKFQSLTRASFSSSRYYLVSFSSCIWPLLQVLLIRIHTNWLNQIFFFLSSSNKKKMVVDSKPEIESCNIFTSQETIKYIWVLKFLSPNNELGTYRHLRCR